MNWEIDNSNNNIGSLQDFVGLIPLRGGSKGIPKKNIRLVNNAPLFSYIAKASLDAGLKTYVSTEDQEIKKLCIQEHASITVIDRPKNLASDHSTTEDVIEHFLNVEQK